MRSSSFLLTTSAVLLLAVSAHADVITDWNGTAIDLGRNTYPTSPNPATRALAIAHLAAYDAVIAIEKTAEPYHADLEATLPASPEAAAAQAFHDTLIALYPAAADDLDDQLADDLDAIEDGDAKDNGVDLGADAAADILALRAADGSETPITDYVGSTDLGKWRPTPTGLLNGLTPEWATVTPFALESPHQFPQAGPPALDSVTYAFAFTEVKLYGKKTGSARTTDQTAIANFWAQQTQIPFNAIARTLAKQKKLSIDAQARLFALLNLAIADSRVAVWDAKYEFESWRPITAIRETDDGNAETVTDAAWEPLLATPNHPEYVSGHSATGAAAATVLAAVFGDVTHFTVASDTAVPPGSTRTYESFSAAAQENADSRVFAGIHFRFSDEEGLDLGEDVGNYVLENQLAEIPSEGGAGGASAGGAGGQSAEGGAPTAEGGSTAAEDGGAGGASEPEPSGDGGVAGTPAEPSASGGASGGSEENGGSPSPSTGGSSAGSGGKGGTGTKHESSSDDSGCSVTATPTRGPSPWQWALVLASGVAWLTRRRKHYSSGRVLNSR